MIGWAYANSKSEQLIQQPRQKICYGIHLKIQFNPNSRDVKSTLKFIGVVGVKDTRGPVYGPVLPPRVQYNKERKLIEDDGTSVECGGLGSTCQSVTELGMSTVVDASDWGISPSGNSGGGCPSSQPAC